MTIEKILVSPVGYIVFCLALFLILFNSYNGHTRRKINILPKDYADIKDKVLNKKITKGFINGFSILFLILLGSAALYFVLLFGAPATAELGKKVGIFINIVFKVWIIESIVLLLILTVREFLITKYLKNMKNNSK